LSPAQRCLALCKGIEREEEEVVVAGVCAYAAKRAEGDANVTRCTNGRTARM